MTTESFIKIKCGDVELKDFNMKLDMALESYDRLLKYLIRAKGIEKIPQDTGMMMSSFINKLDDSSIITDALVVGSDVPYAGFVNRMRPPVKWTKPGSWYHWFDRIKAWAVQKAGELLPEKLRQAGFEVTES